MEIKANNRIFTFLDMVLPYCCFFLKGGGEVYMLSTVYNLLVIGFLAGIQESVLLMI